MRMIILELALGRTNRISWIDADRRNIYGQLL